MVELVRPFIHGSSVTMEPLSLAGPALDIVRQRLSSFGRDTIEVLAAGAVVGRSFDLGLLSAATERDFQSPMGVLDGPCAARVIAPIPGPRGYFSFGHDLIRGVLLQDLPPSELTELHHRVAVAMEQRCPVLGDVPSPELVHHLLSALPRGGLEKAIDYTLRLAHHSTWVCAHADAAAPVITPGRRKWRTASTSCLVTHR